MGIFDNVSSVVINDKEVQSIKIGDNVLYEAESEPVIMFKGTAEVFQSTSSIPFTYSGDVFINFGEGYEQYNGGRIVHSYGSSGDEWTVKIKGDITEVTGFGQCMMSSVVLPSGIISLGDSCFYNCEYLSSVTLPDTLTSLGQYCFSYSNLSEITIPSSVTSIGSYAFGGLSNLESITFESSTPPTCGTNAFMDTSSIVIYVPSGSLSAYTSASNYPSTSDATYEEY